MWRIIQHIPRCTSRAGSSCVRPVSADDKQPACHAVLKSHQRRFSHNFHKKKERRKKQEEPGADREWFRQQACQHHAFEMFGLGSAVVLGLQFGHLCNLYMQRCEGPSHTSTLADAVQHPLCLIQLAEAMPSLHNQGLLMKQILPAAASGTSSAAPTRQAQENKICFEPDSLTSFDAEVSPATKLSRRSLLDDLLLPETEASFSTVLQEEDSASSVSSTMSSSTSIPSRLTSGETTVADLPSTSSTSDPYREFSDGWANLCRQYIGIHGNEKGRVLAEAGDLVGAFQCWHQAAEETGYAKAQFNTALCYETGQGVKKNMKKAAEYYALAAGLTSVSEFQSPLAEAAYNLGVLYLNHPDLMSVQSSPADPRALLEKAAEAGMVAAMRALGQTLLQEDEEEQGLHWLHKAALEYEDAESEYYLGHCYWQGLDTLPPDLDAALEYFERARKNGYPEAEEHIPAVKDQIHKQRFESLIESLHVSEGPGPPSTSLQGAKSAPTLSRSLQHHLLEFNLSEWDSGFSSPTESSIDIWENSVQTTGNSDSRDGKVLKKSQSSPQVSSIDVRFLLGEDAPQKTDERKERAVFHVGETVPKRNVQENAAEDMMFALSVGGFGDVPARSGKTT